MFDCSTLSDTKPSLNKQRLMLADLPVIVKHEAECYCNITCTSTNMTNIKVVFSCNPMTRKVWLTFCFEALFEESSDNLYKLWQNVKIWLRRGFSYSGTCAILTHDYHGQNLSAHILLLANTLWSVWVQLRPWNSKCTHGTYNYIFRCTDDKRNLFLCVQLIMGRLFWYHVKDSLPYIWFS